MGVETAVAVGAIGSALGVGASLYGAHKERKQAKKELRLQQADLARQRAQEMEARKNLINQQREQLTATGSGTRGYSTEGIKANILG